MRADHPRPSPRRTWRQRHVAALRVTLGLALGMALGVAAIVAALALSETRLTVPPRLTDRIEARIDARLAGMAVELGAIEIGIDRSFKPRLWLGGVGLRAADGTRIAGFGDVGVAFSPRAALSGRIAPRVLRVSRAELLVRRDADGAFELRFGGGGTFRADSPAAILAAAEALLDRPPLDLIDEIALAHLAVAFEDAASGRVWQVTGGAASLTRDAAGLRLGMEAEIFNGSDDLARLDLSLETAARDDGARLGLRFEGFAARDLGDLVPALRGRVPLDAPISGALDARLDASGAMGALSGRLDLGAGRVTPGGAAPLPFEAADLAFSYDPAAERIEIEALRLRARAAEADITGRVYLRDRVAGVPRAVVAQIALERLRLAPGLFPEALEAAGGLADLRISFDPFTLTLGQAALPDPGGDPARTIRARGRVTAGPDGWEGGLDLTAEALSVARLPGVWPLPAAPRARDWVARNLVSGEARDLTVALRRAPGARDIATGISFAFHAAEARAVGFLPPITGGAGYFTLGEDRLALRLDAGTMTPTGGEPVALGGSTFAIPDTRARPARGEIALAAAGPVESILALLDAEPMSLLTRAGRGPDLATGRAELAATVSVPLRPNPPGAAIEIAASGDLFDIRSERAMPGRVLTAERLRLAVGDGALSLSGAMEVEGVPFTGSFRTAFAGPERGTGRVAGRVALSPEGLARFGVGLPPGLVTGRGEGDLTIELRRDRPPRLTLETDLRGIGMRIAGVNWAKRPDEGGRLRLEGRLGESPRFDTFALDAPALSARGRVTFAPGPSFRALRLDRVVLGDWLDAPVTIEARAGGPPAIRVPGGSIDLRRADLGKAGGGGGGDGGSGRGPVVLALDRLQLTDTVALTPARVEIAPGAALQGTFRGKVNGGVEIDGQLEGGAQGTAIRITSRSAGAVLRDAGLLSNLRGGAMEIVLRPTGIRGAYDGRVSVDTIVLRDAPAIAELLAAISVVGLVDQLQGQGIIFDRVEAEFRLTPDLVTIYRSSATGRSMGLSVDGSFDPRRKLMDLQGVLSPLYLVNRIGAIFTRRGEGLFGVNFTLRGPVDRPQVAANPLSILTPGMFREIFRRPPPERPGN